MLSPGVVVKNQNTLPAVRSCSHVLGVRGVRCSCGFDSARSQNFIGTPVVVETAMRQSKNTGIAANIQLLDVI